VSCGVLAISRLAVWHYAYVAAIRPVNDFPLLHIGA
jgi:hypothetical protein